MLIHEGSQAAGRAKSNAARLAAFTRDLLDAADATQAAVLAIDAAMNLLECDAGWVAHALDGGGTRVLASRGSPGPVDSGSLSAWLGRVGEVMADGHEALHLDLNSDSRAPEAIAAAAVASGRLAVGRRGVLVVASEEQRNFAANDLATLQVIVDTLSLAIRGTVLEGLVQILRPEGRDMAVSQHPEVASQDARADLEERVKELSCLYAVSRTLAELRPHASSEVWEEALWQVVRTIPQGWQSPARLGVRLILDGTAYSAGFFPADDSISTPVLAAGEVIGALEVCYVEATRVFLPQESELLREIAEKIGAAFERRRADAALALSELKFRQIAENSRDVFWVRSTSTGQLEYVSPAFAMLWPAQLSGDQDLNHHWLGGIHAEDRASYLRAIDNLFSGGAMEVQYRVFDSTGEMHWIRDNASTVTNAAHELVWAGGIARDITDRKRIEDALANERLLALIHTSPVGMFIADHDGRIMLINREAERILDRADSTAVDEHGLAREMLYRDGSVIPDDERPLNRALHRRETVRAAEVMFRHGNRTITTLTNTTPFYSPDGAAAGAIAVIQDVSHFEEIDRLRGEFLGMISHELRTPLTIIKGCATLGLDTAALSTTDVAHYFELIDRQSDHLRGLVDNLLDMTAIEAGHLAVRPKPTDLRQLLEGAIEAMRRTSPARTIELQISEPLQEVMADYARVLQVVHNLLGNACKFSPDAAPIHVNVVADGAFVRVSVSDRGAGIEPAKLTAIFGKFARLAETTTREGLGLGLTIAKGLIEAHGGRIWAESGGVDQGATFHFTLPMSHETKGIERRPVDARGLRVLVLDDEPQILTYLQRILSASGYEVKVTFDVSEARGLVVDGQTDLLLLDLFLGGKSGFDVLRDLRGSSDIPIIILTSSDDDENAVRALHLGADDYVRKPFSSAELDARIQAVLRRHATTTPVAQAPIQIGDLSIDIAGHAVFKRGERLELSATEHALLVELVLNAGKVLTHRLLLERVWGPEYTNEVTLIRPYIKSLRKKLGDDAREPQLIFTERRVGYRFAKTR